MTEISASFTIERKVGRLIEARVFSLRNAQHAASYTQAFAVETGKFSRSIRPVLCADHRPVVVYPGDVADQLVALFTDMNSRLERVAILVAPTNATLTLQLQRISREARYANRRVFHDPEQAIAHLSAALDLREIARARAFLDGFKPDKRD